MDQHWRQFFAGLEDNAALAKQQVDGPSWQRKDWPKAESGELVSALDGNWPVVPPPAAKGAKGAAPEAKAPALSADDVRKATMDSVRALMMIRAYRMRGHLAADLDPLKLVERESHPELDPATYGFSEADLDWFVGALEATLEDAQKLGRSAVSFALKLATAGAAASLRR